MERASTDDHDNIRRRQFHVGFARTNGVTITELTEAITHLAFYTGWPNGMGAMTVAKQVLTVPTDGDGEDSTA